MANIAEMQEIVDRLTEEQALLLLNLLESRFGWATILFNRADAESRFASLTNADDERPLTDDQWDAVRSSPEWEYLFGTTVFEVAWDNLDRALTETLKLVTCEHGVAEVLPGEKCNCKVEDESKGEEQA